jgi:hypothetical protein
LKEAESYWLWNSDIVPWAVRQESKTKNDYIDIVFDKPFDEL